VVSVGVECGDAVQGPHRRVNLEEANDSEEGAVGNPSRGQHELGGISMAALGDADEVARRWLGGMVTLTCARRTDGEAVSYDGGVGPTQSGRLRL
jgi:hypothetical protein